MRKMLTARGSLQTYEKATLDMKGKHFAVATSKGKSKFVLYNNSYIRKTTALYLVQEGTRLSVDRLLRVRAAQLKHIYTTPESRAVLDNLISSGNLCIFKRVECSQCLIGRVLQFSYLEGTKRQRQFSSDLVDLSKDSVNNIGVYAN